MSQMALTELPAISNYHIYPATLYPNEAINRCKKSSRTRDLTIFYIFPSNIQYIYWLGAKKSIWIFSCARVRIRLNEFSPSNICLYTIAAAQDRRGGSNRLRAYLVQDRRKLGSNQHRWRDMVMMQSALITCLPYIIQTNCQPTIAHHFIMEKCVNVHKSPMKNVMMLTLILI